MTATHAPRRGLDTSSLEAYLRQIGETPLLSAAEEAELARRIQQGDGGARDHLVRANLRLVVRVARRYAGRGLDLPDLIAEGNLGLLRAADGFDPSRGTRFSTYAVHWIKQSIRRALYDTSRLVRLPGYVVQLLAKWRRASAALAEELGRPPSEAEVAHCLKLSVKKLRLLRKATRLHGGAAQREDPHDFVSLEELVADGRAPSPEALLEGADVLQAALRLVGGLDGRAQDILALRFGLGGQEPKTLREVGRRLGLTRERVRQIEKKALDALREKLLGD